MRPEDLFELTWAADPRLSPDGTTVAYAVVRVDRDENAYPSAIWTAPADGSRPPRRLTAGTKSDGSPRWSPDGRSIAFTSNRDGERKQLYVLSLDGGDPVRLTDLPEDVLTPVWSPNGTRLAFVSRVPDPAYEEEDERRRAPRRFTRHHYKLDSVGWTGDRRRHVFTVAADGSAEPTQLTNGDFEHAAPAWSPDGESLAFASARDEDWDVKLARQLYVVAASGGEPRRVTSGDDLHDAPSWSPDGRLLACRWQPGGWDQPHYTHIAVVDVESGERRVVTEDAGLQCAPFPEIREPLWDGDAIVFAVEDRGNTRVYRVAAAGGPVEPVVDGDVWVTGFDVAAGTIVHTATTPAMPAELFAGARRLTDVSAAFCELAQPVEPERFVATAPDGADVEAWLMRPHGFEEGRRYPTLLNIHGGPFSQYGNKFFDEFQVYARRGYAVLYSNPRGSSGYGEEWGRAIRGRGAADGDGWGSLDYADLMAVVDTALERFDFLDPERLGVMGGSYGGYMTSWIVGHTDRFKAGCSERAVNNMLSEFGSSDLGWFIRTYIGVWPFEDPGPYLAQSPTTYADRIATPLLILHSENDLRCSVEQAEHLFTILRLLRRDVELVRFPAESHELTRSGSPIHRQMRFDILLEWFGRHLPAGAA